MAKTDVHDVEPSRLANLLHLSDEPEQVWHPDDLAKMLQEQLTAPVEYDLTRLGGGPASGITAAARAQGLLVRSMRDLLGHPNPPAELLEMTKRFAKAAREQPDSPIPREIATVVYFASIAAALARCGKRITDLDDSSLRTGFAWACEQTWVDADTRALISEASRLLPV